MQLDRYVYKICIDYIERDELRMSRQAMYIRQRSGPAQFEFTDNRFSRDAVHNATPHNRFYWAYIQDLTVYLTDRKHR